MNEVKIFKRTPTIIDTLFQEIESLSGNTIDEISDAEIDAVLFNSNNNLVDRILVLKSYSERLQNERKAFFLKRLLSAIIIKRSRTYLMKGVFVSALDIIEMTRIRTHKAQRQILFYLLTSSGFSIPFDSICDYIAQYKEYRNAEPQHLRMIVYKEVWDANKILNESGITNLQVVFKKNLIYLDYTEEL